jgi:polyhydroxyalkanoate synthesis repressor PhaR
MESAPERARMTGISASLILCDGRNNLLFMADKQEPEARRLEIKKYANRRYYDSTQSRHLTLSQIRELIEEGYEISVKEAKTGRDITASVLTQMLLELEPEKLEVVPVPLLLWLLRMKERSVKESLGKHFAETLASFSRFERQLEEQSEAQGLPAALPLIAKWTKAVVAPLKAGFSPPPTKEEPPAERPGPQGTEAGDDFGELLGKLKSNPEQFEAILPKALKSKKTNEEK